MSEADLGCETIVATGSVRSASDVEVEEGHLEPGARVGRYVVLSRVGAGAMGVVYAAYDPELDRKVALKLLRGAGRRRGETARARLLREAQAMARLRHPNVVTVYDAGILDAQGNTDAAPGESTHVFVAMEFIEGTTLRAWYQAEPRSWKAVLDVMLDVGRGVAAAHDAGLVHRDLKPDNIMIDEDGRVFVMDFGLVRAGSEIETSRSGEHGVAEVTRSSPSLPGVELTHGALVGSPAYMAPEQFVGKIADTRSDQFSYCVMFFELLHGARPFAGQTLAEIVTSVTTGTIREGSGEGVPGWIHRVVVRGLERDPDGRHGSMSDLLAALGRDPRPARLRWAAGAFVLATAGAVWGAHALDRRATAKACRAEAGKMAEIWNENVQAELGVAFSTVGGAYGLQTIERVAPWIDAFASRWSDLRERACLAEPLGELQGDQYLRAERCLDEELERVSVTLEAWGQPTQALVHGAVSAAAGLPLLDHCIDPRRVLRDPEIGVADEARAALRRDLLRYQARVHSGLSADVDHVRELRSRAESLGDDVFLARALLYLVEARGDVGDQSGAIEAAREAYRAANRAGRDDLVASSASYLVHYLAIEMEQTERALVWLDVAAAALERLGDGDDLKHARHLRLRAAVSWQTKQFDEAQVAIERALEIQQGILGEDHPDLVTTLNGLGLIHRGAGRLDEARTTYERTLQLVERTSGPEHPYAAGLHFNLSYLFEQLDRADDAVAHAERALEIWQLHLEPRHPDVLGAMRAVARARLNAGGFEAAVEILERLEQLAELEPSRSENLPHVRFDLARALWEIGSDPARALTLARLARDAAHDHPRESLRQLTDQIDTWLADKQ